MYQAGIENVVSSSGTALTIDQIRLIRRFTTTITVLYDGDAAGIKAALRGIDLLLEEGFRIKVVLLPDGEDPDSFARSHSNTELQAYLDEHETDFIHFKIDLYHEEMERDPLRRAELISDIMRSIALIPDSIQRAVLIQSSSTALRMSEELLQSEVNKLRRQGVTAQGFTSPQRTAPVAPLLHLHLSLRPSRSRHLPSLLRQLTNISARWSSKKASSPSSANSCSCSYSTAIVRSSSPRA